MACKIKMNLPKQGDGLVMGKNTAIWVVQPLGHCMSDKYEDLVQNQPQSLISWG